MTNYRSEADLPNRARFSPGPAASGWTVTGTGASPWAPRPGIAGKGVTYGGSTAWGRHNLSIAYGGYGKFTKQTRIYNCEYVLTGFAQRQRTFVDYCLTPLINRCQVILQQPPTVFVNRFPRTNVDWVCGTFIRERTGCEWWEQDFRRRCHLIRDCTYLKPARVFVYPRVTHVFPQSTVICGTKWFCQPRPVWALGSYICRGVRYDTPFKPWTPRVYAQPPQATAGPYVNVVSPSDLAGSGPHVNIVSPSDLAGSGPHVNVVSPSDLAGSGPHVNVVSPSDLAGSARPPSTSTGSPYSGGLA